MEFGGFRFNFGQFASNVGANGMRQLADVRILPRTVAAASSSAAAGMGFHTFSSAGVVQRNFAAAEPSQWSPVDGSPMPKLEPTDGFDGEKWWGWTADPAAPESAAVVAKLALDRMPSLTGQAVYAAVEVRSKSNETTVMVKLDPGSGDWADAAATPVPVGRATLVSGAVMAEPNGTLRCAITVRRAAGAAAVDLGPVVLAPVGAAFRSVKTDDEQPAVAQNTRRTLVLMANQWLHMFQYLITTQTAMQIWIDSCELSARLRRAVPVAGSDG